MAQLRSCSCFSLSGGGDAREHPHGSRVVARPPPLAAANEVELLRIRQRVATGMVCSEIGQLPRLRWVRQRKWRAAEVTAHNCGSGTGLFSYDAAVCDVWTHMSGASLYVAPGSPEEIEVVSLIPKWDHGRVLSVELARFNHHSVKSVHGRRSQMMPKIVSNNIKNQIQNNYKRGRIAILPSVACLIINNGVERHINNQ